ncbi:hypothetical protein PT974_10682 [Cladobotryum mycophilum]|uniref:Conserved oligomeric Golgi complex subunit 1 n=1 Tax=Cladobotryum mycophilum TaxID=491253 RepID=A0ABR0SAJ5_9HYPO
MAATDPTKFTSSDQIFSANHTLPQIRSIHKALHVEIEDKAGRLRTQVGSSYRDLLGTADTIVQMRGDNDAVQDLLGKMGWRCGRTVVSTKATGLAKFMSKEKKSDVADAARQKLLDSCFLVVGRILKGKGQLDNGVTTGDGLVLATKVWVLSRLLVKSLGTEFSNEEARQAVETARKTLDSLRRRLRRALEKTLGKVSQDSDREDILKALCAHSLVNSSGAKDALRYFLEVRGKAMTLGMEESGYVRTADDVIQALKLYTRTLLDVQALVPGKLSQTLQGLTKNPLLEDTSLQQLEGLRLDIFERWCSEEIQYFTPFIRHDDLEGKQAREALTDWSEKGGDVLLEGLNKTLAHMADFKSIMELRTSVIQLWIREGGKVRGFDPQDTQDSLREVFNSRMLAVLETKVSKLHIVGSEVKATLEGWQKGTTGKLPGLWEEDGYHEALSRGAASFIQEVASRFYGRSDAVSKAINCYSSWFHVIHVVKDVVESLKKQRWDNDYDEIEDEETIEARQQLLSKDDPNMLQDKLDTTLDTSFKALEDEIRKLWEDRADGDKNGEVAMYLVRVLRDIRRQLPKRETIGKFGLVMVPSMHRKIAMCVSTPPATQFATTSLSKRTVVGRPLWEGVPALPNQPSSEVFQFLHGLSRAMADAGVDLWTSAAAAALKQYVSEQLCQVWNKELEALSSTSGVIEPEKKEEEKQGGEKSDENEENGDNEEKDENEEKGENEAKDEREDEKVEDSSLTIEQAQEICTQWLFDISLLQCSIGSGSGEAADVLEKLEEAVFKKSGLEDQSRQRIGKAARGFWNRTNLLFGLLA